MNAASAFAYPVVKHEWRHGPMGYAGYGSYREWLRDEFSFRCVYCLRREQWNIRFGAFHLDHFIPQSVDSSLVSSYENLLYVCAACNLKKSDLETPHPSIIAFGDCVRVHSDGKIEPINAEGELLIDLLRLDDADCTRFRKLLLETFATLEKHDHETLIEWLRFPDELPDLTGINPPGGNSRPDGRNESWHAKKERGELPEAY